jgi:hypothetical protein
MQHSVALRVAGAIRRTWPDDRRRHQALSLFAASVTLLVGAISALPSDVRWAEASLVHRLRGALPEQATADAAGGAQPPAAADATAPPAAAPPAAPGPGPVPAADQAPLDPARLPAGKGMWIWLPEHSDGGDPAALVARAKAVGLSHVFVRTGSSWMGFYAQSFLDRLLPVAHAAGLKVYGWDFPNLRDWKVDAERALAAIHHTTPDGHRIDGFAADVETRSEGVNLTGAGALAYGTYLRQGVGRGYPLIACVPRMLDLVRHRYPYRDVVAQFDAIAPMVYWMARDPVADVSQAIDYLRQFGKPLMPVGQTFDGGPEGGPPGHPPRDAVLGFIAASAAKGATAVSFWSWQHASQENWDAIRDAPQFLLPAAPASITPPLLPPILPLPR